MGKISWCSNFGFQVIVSACMLKMCHITDHKERGVLLEALEPMLNVICQLASFG